MGIFSSIFSAPETISKTVDAVIKSGDALIFTDEEQSIANQKKLDWLLAFHEKSSGSNLARRLLAVMTVGTFLMLVVVTFGMMAAGLDNTEQVKQFVIESLVDPVMTIIAFYFGVAAIGLYKK